MRRILIIVLVLAIASVGLVLWKHHTPAAKPAEEKPPDEGSHVTHDESGRVVVKMDDEIQGHLGLLVAKPPAAAASPELKGYGRVLDPGPLVGLMIELATAQAAAIASSNELARLQLLAVQQNTSERALQAAQAAAARDQLAVRSALDRLALGWGKGIAGQTNLAAFIQPLTTQAAVLVRVDLPVGETLPDPPARTRIAALSGKSVDAEYLGTSANVDPQTLGRGAMFLIQPNALNLMPGEAVTGYLELPGQPLTGISVPRASVVRAEGRAWIYIMGTGGDSFTRTEISLDRPMDGGWFVGSGVSTNDYVVTTGAQTLLSEEQKASLKAD